MSKLIKRISFLLAALLSFCVPAAAKSSAINAESETAEPAIIRNNASPTHPSQLAAENERVVLPIPGDDVLLYYVYDEQGKRIGRLPTTGYAENAKLVRKDTLLYQKAGGNETLVRAGDLKTVVSLPSEDYALLCFGTHYAVIEKKANIVTLYDESMTATGSIAMQAAFDPDSYISGKLLDLSDRYLLKLSDYEENAWLYFFKDGQESRQLYDPAMLSLLDHPEMIVRSLGQFIVTSPYSFEEESDVRGVVMTVDGTVLMRDIAGVMTEQGPAGDGLYLDNSVGTSQIKASFAVQYSDKAYHFYGTSLEYLGSLNEEPEFYDSCSSGFIKGFPYPELSGNICAGFVFDVDTQSWIPYAQSGESLLIWKDGRSIDIRAEGSPQKISSAYLVTSINYQTTNVYKLKDNSLMASYSRDPYLCVSLGSAGILLSDSPETKEWWKNTATIYDNEGVPTYHSKSSRLYASPGGTWTCHRGIYRGLVDLYGNWVIKDASDWEI